MQPAILVGLILCNVTWSLHPILGKIILEDFSPGHFAWMRYFGAFLAYGFITQFYGRSGRFLDIRRTSGSVRVGVFLIGLLTFCLSPWLQSSGLLRSQATDNALIIAMEPVIAVVLATLFLRERLSGVQITAFGLGLAGFLLLSGGGDIRALGNLLMLVSVSFEAAYTVLGRGLLNRNPGTGQAIFGTALLVGVSLLTVGVLSSEGLPDLSRLTPGSAGALLWIGPIGTAATYLFWMKALEKIPVASLVLTLFIQPVLGAFFGVALLGDSLSVTEWFGAVMILAGLGLGVLRR